MTDDFVKQLRALAIAHESGLNGSAIFICLKLAADEIERLRAERIRWEKITHDLYRRVDVYGEVCCCDNYDMDWCGIHAYDDEIKGLKKRGKA